MLLSFRAEDVFAKQTDQAAKLAGVSRSDYLRAAVEERNNQVLKDRITYLSRQLSADHLEENQALENTNMDGLHEG